MDKKAAISIISQAAKVYNEQINHKNLLIIYGPPSKPSFLETRANETNFLHLTGMVLNENINGNSPDKFFQDALDERLSEEVFRFKDKTTAQKLNVLVQTLRVASNASMIGDYNFNPRHIRLQTDKFAGSVSSCLGLFKPDENSRYYIPNSVLESDIRDEVFSAERVLAIVSKKIEEKEYNKIEKVAKKIDINRLLQTIKQNVPIALDLISLSPEKKDEITLQKEAAVKKCDEILKANPELKAKLNAAAADYLSKHNLPPLDSSSPADKRYEMRNKILKENPELMEEYINAKSEYEKKQLVPTAAKPTKSFAEGLEEFSKRRSENGSQKPPTHNDDLSPKRRK